jgi:predicted RecB family nuclease
MSKIYPTNLIDFLQCRHLANLRKIGLKGSDHFPEDVLLLREKGREHEVRFLSSLGEDVTVIDSDAPLVVQQEQTQEAVKNKVKWIYQAYMENGDCAGHADFLKLVDDSKYEVVDTKLANKPSPANAIQLVHYNELTAKLQGSTPEKFHVMHGNDSMTTLKRTDVINYYEEVLKDYRLFLLGNEKTEPFPIPFCHQCSFQEHCKSYLEKHDHLAQLPGMKNNYINPLKEAEITRVEQLLSSELNTEVSIPASTLSDLQKSADALVNKRIFLKSPELLDFLNSSINNSLYMIIHKNLQSGTGQPLSFFMGVLTENGRFESLFFKNAQEEKSGVERMLSFISRYLSKHHSAKLFVESSRFAKMLHDLSNRYNICHDEMDELLIKKKIVPIQSLINRSLILPGRTHTPREIIQQLEPDYSVENSLLDRSPQLIHELYSSADYEEGLELIRQRAEAEISQSIRLLRKLASLNAESFPLSVKSANG